MPVRTRTQRIDRPRRQARAKPPPSPAGRILAALSVVLILAAVVWLTAMYFQGRSPQVQGPLPSFAPTLEPSTPEPTETPSPTPAATESPSNEFPLDLPGFGNN